MRKVEFRLLDSEYYLVTSEGIASWQSKMSLKDIRMSRWGREEAVLTAWSSGVVPFTTVQSCCRRMAFCALVGQGCGWYPKRKLQCYKCFAVGHTQVNCRSAIDRNSNCFNCGHTVIGCKATISLYVPLGICLLTIRLVGRDVALIRAFALDNSGYRND